MTGSPAARARHAFDLDRVGSTQFGATLYATVIKTIDGESVSFFENELTDLQILCYYAHSDLYTGSADARTSMLGGRCGGAFRLEHVITRAVVQAQECRGVPFCELVEVLSVANGEDETPGAFGTRIFAIPPQPVPPFLTGVASITRTITRPPDTGIVTIHSTALATVSSSNPDPDVVPPFTMQAGAFQQVDFTTTIPHTYVMTYTPTDGSFSDTTALLSSQDGSGFVVGISATGGTISGGLPPGRYQVFVGAGAQIVLDGAPGNAPPDTMTLTLTPPGG